MWHVYVRNLHDRLDHDTPARRQPGHWFRRDSSHAEHATAARRADLLFRECGASLEIMVRGPWVGTREWLDAEQAITEFEQHV